MAIYKHNCIITKYLASFIGALLISVGSIQAQSGWTKKKGEYFLKLNYTTGSSDKYFTINGDELTTAEFTQSNASLYAEYGLTDKITLLAHGPIFRTQKFETTETISAIGDLPIGLKYSLLQGAIPLSIGLVVDIPLAKADNFANNKEIANTRINLPTGDGEWNYRLTLAASHSFYPTPVYVSAYSTYNYRTEYENTSFSDQLIAGVEGGVNIANKVWLSLSVQFQDTFGDPEVVDFVRGEGTEFTAINVSATYMITERLGANASFFSYNDLIFNRVNLYSANIFGIGLTYELKK
ncbi:hypothetical protein [Fulvivirga lutea]|uniref:Uncharacterized protein n=1 Tax=Fulvivirga lutea TaxID=2810512 RepID=A0A975A1B7_9BACT|nr:hypothetical protein [Fulvivirga lutea]QSE98274.1 hypothetical protein JR347_04120 [Fulvivirga lutea]